MSTVRALFHRLCIGKFVVLPSSIVVVYHCPMEALCLAPSFIEPESSMSIMYWLSSSSNLLPPAGSHPGNMSVASRCTHSKYEVLRSSAILSSTILSVANFIDREVSRLSCAEMTTHEYFYAQKMISSTKRNWIQSNSTPKPLLITCRLQPSSPTH